MERERPFPYMKEVNTEGNPELLNTPIREWVKQLQQGKEAGESTRLGYIAQLIRSVPQSNEQRQLLHPKLYPWLRDNCALAGIETVGDLLKVFKTAPPPLETSGFVEPWTWFALRPFNGTNSILKVRDIFIEKGLLP
jgi:hypothetical protein